MKRNDSSSPAPPPVVPPPVVSESKACDHALSLSRFFVPSAIGVFCLIVGVVVGQTNWLGQADVDSDSTVALIETSKDVSVSAPLDTVEEVAVTEHPSLPVEATISATETADEAEVVDVVVHQGIAAVVPAVGHATQAFADYVSNQWSELSTENQNAEPISPDPRITTRVAADADEPTCESGQCQEEGNRLGTLVHWADEPDEAFRLARDKDKLVFLIHVSGNFEIPGFT